MTGDVSIALSFTWLGAVLAISFLEAPLKFRAPGVTRRIGLGIGRIVFRALHGVQILLAAALLLLGVVGDRDGGAWLLLTLAVVVLAAQVALFELRMDRRAVRIVAGEELPPSPLHLVYIGLELAKVVALVGLGTALLG
jgi:hypothetical protein